MRASPLKFILAILLGSYQCTADSFLDTCIVCTDKSGWGIQQLRGVHQSEFTAQCHQAENNLQVYKFCTLDLNQCIVNYYNGTLGAAAMGNFTIGDVHNQGCVLCHVDLTLDGAPVLCVCGSQRDVDKPEGMFMRTKLDGLVQYRQEIPPKKGKQGTPASLWCIDTQYSAQEVDGCPEP
ncbi:hypothetical protein B0T19DRAFT_470836 [Cercophora scortea]|uniref:Cyanovirin-N domain-containing protein n=1 Tax=Cercophora scortea TaxID=314031 RepID=A0AAE0J2B1_9PEZI|nr:hypothetical protein B0T19DRAFT_470836 [Cercophora scortea]